jgi:phosphopantetheinyl transferase (holo-ACP synthase)
MRRGVEILAKSTNAKNGDERITTDRDNARHLEYFNNGQWRHSDKCKEFTNKECTFKALNRFLR